MNRRQIITLALAIALAAALALVIGGGYVYYRTACRAVVIREHWVYVHPSEPYDSLLAHVRPALGDDSDFRWFCRMAVHYELPSRTAAGGIVGAYKLRAGMTARAVAVTLSRRWQTPVRITFHNVRRKEDLAGRIARRLMADSTQILAAMNDSGLCRRCGTDTVLVANLFLPDTYEVYWNIAPADLVQRMETEHRRFWNDARRAKASALGLSPDEAAIIASIAEEETADRAERGVVARLYWNRLQRGMPLQADPTVKYAVGDFTLRRILQKHLAVESPYNTYRHTGLPPGPIRIAEKATIDSLLDSRPHPYIYMCAKEDFSGRHNFATTLTEHNRNAARYHQALRARGVF